MKHTKGRWEIDQRSLYRGEEVISDEDGQYIASIINKKDSEESDANARLIAAAPELLEFAIMVKEYREGFKKGEIKVGLRGLHSIAVKLIKKATE